MCGRYTLLADAAQLALRFGFDARGLTLEPGYNIAPTQQVLAVREGASGRAAGLMRWGLIPPGARSPSAGAPIINARAETLAERPAFRDALRSRRCLVPADGFYEWRGNGAIKRPMRITLRTGEPFAFAGLWAEWRSPRGERMESCAIVTTAANSFLSPLHDRMPVILPKEREELWLDPLANDAGLLSQLLEPYAPAEMRMDEVSPLVNSSANNFPEVLVRPPMLDLR